MSATDAKRAITRTVSQRIDDARAVICWLLVDDSQTTASTGIEPRDFPDPVQAAIWAELGAMEDSADRRDVGPLVQRLRRRGVEPGRELRLILATDPSIVRAHFQWVCSEVRRHADLNRRFAEACRTVAALEREFT